MARAFDGVEERVEQHRHPSLLRKLTGAAYQGWSYFSFSHMGALLDRGDSRELDEKSAVPFHPDGAKAKELQRTFESIYYTQKKRPDTMHIGKSLLLLEWRRLLFHLFLLTIEEAVRLSGPFVLRQFLIWLEDYKDDRAEYWEGWMRGGLLFLVSLVFAFSHHRFFWVGGFVGYRMRTALLASIHGKLFRLNTSNVAHITTGYVVNVASNDLKRFDNALIFWPYLFVGPFETVFVLLILTLYLGFLPALAGVSCILAIIPVQSLLYGYMSRCRMRTAKVTDKRVDMTGELISGHLAVKMLGWEDPLSNDVAAIRKKEHKLLTVMGYIRGAGMSMSGITLSLIAASTFITYRFTNGVFNVTDVFFTLSLATLPRKTMANFFVMAVELMSSTWVTCERVNAFLSVPEPRNTHSMDSSDPKGTVEITDGNFGWYSTPDGERKSANTPRDSLHRSLSKLKRIKSKKEDPKLIQTLNNVSLFIKPGELIGIVGSVGSGKSSLLSALLNDMEDLSPTNGNYLSGRTSFCSQTPWIVSGSVRENITFGHAFEKTLYEEAVESCALEVDFDQFPGGDSTELGEKGINISGGQKARIALARAAFSQADIHLLDDPLSTVDPRVSRILFERCIGSEGMMKNSTRLLVTHQRQFLPLCDRIVLMNDGTIEAVGTWEELSDHHILKITEHIDEYSEVSLDSVVKEAMIETTDQEKCTASHDSPSSSTMRSRSLIQGNGMKDQGNAKLVETEGKEVGKISLHVFWEYLKHIGLVPMMSAFLLLLISHACFFSGEWWLATWASIHGEDQGDLKWVWILVIFITVGVVTNLISSCSTFFLLIMGSTRLHKAMLHCVLRAPLKFFHTNPTGRILNRFAKDLGLQDEELPIIIVDLMLNLTVVMGTFVLVSIALPYMLIFFFGIAWAFWRIRRRYVMTSREVKRFDGVTRSPVFSMLSANIKGLATIRAYGTESTFQERFLRELDLNGSWWTAFLSTSRWVGFRMDSISAAVMFFSVLLSVVLADKVSLEVLGLALTYTLMLNDNLQWTVRQTAEFENGMTAVERNMEYTELEQEPPRESEGGGSAPEEWPSKGAIEYASVTASYRPGLDPVLENLSFVIPGGSSVGIVGRTGSGKSSLLLTLFRLIDINNGEIKIDNVDVSKIGTDVLRRQLAVIPQDPVLFGGTLRSNLDPLNQHSKAKIWDVLKKVCLDAAAGNVGGLDAKVADCGSNLSVGQRQLLCLARALLADAKILALDEATANVDRTTDALIQDSLRSLITHNEKTLLIIAHRIDTVLNCDLLLVLDDGHVIEFGSPQELLSNREGVFAGMVRAAKRATRFQ